VRFSKVVDDNFYFHGGESDGIEGVGRSYVEERQGGNGGLFRRGPTDGRRTGVCRRHGRRHATPALGVLSRTDGATPGRAVACTRARVCARVYCAAAAAALLYARLRAGLRHPSLIH